jgi:hypothetical protein
MCAGCNTEKKYGGDPAILKKHGVASLNILVPLMDPLHNSLQLQVLISAMYLPKKLFHLYIRIGIIWRPHTPLKIHIVIKEKLKYNGT